MLVRKKIKTHTWDGTGCALDTEVIKWIVFFIELILPDELLGKADVPRLVIIAVSITGGVLLLFNILLVVYFILKKRGTIKGKKKGWLLVFFFFFLFACIRS